MLATELLLTVTGNMAAMLYLYYIHIIDNKKLVNLKKNKQDEDTTICYSIFYVATLVF